MIELKKGIISDDAVNRLKDEKGGRSAVLVAMSSSEVFPRQSKDYIEDSYDGYAKELEACGETATTVPIAGVNSTTFPDKLRINSDISWLEDTETIILTDALFNVYDVQVDGSEDQDDTVHSLITSSMATGNQVQPVSNVLYGLFPNIALSYFRPSVKLNGLYVWNGLSNNLHKNRNKGDMSVGVEYPFQWSDNFYVGGKLDEDKIAINGAAAYRVVVNDVTKLVRCAVKAELRFLYF